MPHVKAFKQKYPDVRIKIENVTIKNVRDILDSGAIDFAVLSSPVEVEDEKEHYRMSIKYVDEFQDILVCGREFFDQAYQDRRLRDLIELPMVSMPEGTSTGSFMIVFLKSIISGRILSFHLWIRFPVPLKKVLASVLSRKMWPDPAWRMGPCAGFLWQSPSRDDITVL